ncbi:MAG: hypothetical protein ABGZ17_30420, partial [Planctomycetaceae bacterium]
MAQFVRVLLATVISLICAEVVPVAVADQPRDKRVVRWSFEDALPGAVHGMAEGHAAGPRAPLYPTFDNENTALGLESPAWLQIPDPAGNGRFDFDNGDTITL